MEANLEKEASQKTQTREERVAECLRENLRKRKQQQKLRIQTTQEAEDTHQCP